MSRYRFGAFVLDSESRVLLRDDQPVAMTGKVLDLLLVLVEHHGKVVDKDELLSQLWPAVVVEEANLTQGIFTLRKVLGDNPRDHRYIATVAGRGYQFVAPVSEVRIPDEPATALGEGRAMSAGGPRRNRMLWTGAGMSVLALTAVGMWLWAGARARSPAGQTQRAIPFTSQPGMTRRPAFSPDGKQIAYYWSGEDNNRSIYVKLIGSEAHLRLTTPPGRDFTPTWSPDGKYIAFYRDLPGASGYYVVSALGGAVRQILRSEVGFLFARAAWFPDGKRLAVVQSMTAEPPNAAVPLSELPARLVSVDLDTGDEKPLTSPPADGTTSDYLPVFSPDGKTLAFVRARLCVADIFVMPLGGRARRLTSTLCHSAPDWTADGREIVYTETHDGEWEIRRIPVDGGPSRQITSSTDYLFDPTVARQGDRLAYARMNMNEALWRVDLSGSDPPGAGPPTRAIYSTRGQIDPMYSPDGSRVAFSSDRGGTDAIWVSDPDGRNPLQLTHEASLSPGSPRWSPDGSRIAFDGHPEGRPEIYVVAAGGGDPRVVTSNPAGDFVPSWSRDGQWIYFASKRTGDFQIWKTPASGESPSRPAVQWTQGGGMNAFESADGKYLYFAKGRGETGLWRKPLAGGPGAREEPVLETLQYWGWWALGARGIYFLERPGGLPTANADLKYLDLTSRRISRLLTLDRPVDPDYPAITVSPDGRHLIYQASDSLEVSNIVLLEGFR